MIKNIGTLKIETDRLILRKFELRDAEDMFHNWANDDDVTKYMTWTSHQDINVTKYVLSSWIDQYGADNYYRWCIESKETGQVIGGIDVVQIIEDLDCCEIGYCLSKRYWNKGIMTEALIAVENFLFDKVSFRRIQACHDTKNPASGKVMIKSGMQYEGIRRQAGKNNTGEFCDLATYAILRSDWQKD